MFAYELISECLDRCAEKLDGINGQTASPDVWALKLALVDLRQAVAELAAGVERTADRD